MKFFQFKRTQRKYKTRYKIGNWAAYEGGLRQRGSVTIWLSEDVRKAWCYGGRRKPGGKQIYSNVAIETCWTIGMLYALPLRQTEGLIESCFQLAGVSLPVPDHTVVSRRVRKIGKVPMVPSESKRPIHLLVDSGGLRIHVGSTRKPLKRRAWRKIHLAMDRDTGEIMAADLTASNTSDATRVPALLGQIDGELDSFCGDGAYDKELVYQQVTAHTPHRRTLVVIPPQRGALLHDDPALADRNRHIRSIERVGRRQWHLRSSFTKRSRVDNVVYRYKVILGREMKARTLAGQRVEARIGCGILNRMAKLGMPESFRAA